jgi:hypothetical protein
MLLTTTIMLIKGVEKKKGQENSSSAVTRSISSICVVIVLVLVGFVFHATVFRNEFDCPAHSAPCTQICEGSAHSTYGKDNARH